LAENQLEPATDAAQASKGAPDERPACRVSNDFCSISPGLAGNPLVRRAFGGLGLGPRYPRTAPVRQPKVRLAERRRPRGVAGAEGPVSIQEAQQYAERFLDLDSLAQEDRLVG
jgi:hypothetical protein